VRVSHTWIQERDEQGAARTLSPGSSTGVAMLTLGESLPSENICLCRSMMRRRPGSNRSMPSFARVRNPLRHMSCERTLSSLLCMYRFSFLSLS